MRNICSENHKTRVDKRAKFAVELVFYDDEKNIIEPSLLNFKSFYIDLRENKYEVSKNGNDFTNCFIKDGKLYARFENHGLRTGCLKWQVILQKEITPDSGQGFTNNMMSVPVTKFSDIELIDNEITSLNCCQESPVINDCYLIATESFVFPCFENIIPPITSAEINENGELIITTPDGVFNAGIAKGEKGDAGEQGIQGETGKDGLTTSITIGNENFNVDENGNITLPDYPDTSNFVKNSSTSETNVIIRPIVDGNNVTIASNNLDFGTNVGIVSVSNNTVQNSVEYYNQNTDSSITSSINVGILTNSESFREFNYDNTQLKTYNILVKDVANQRIYFQDYINNTTKEVVWDNDLDDYTTKQYVADELISYAKKDDIPKVPTLLEYRGDLSAPNSALRFSIGSLNVSILRADSTTVRVRLASPVDLVVPVTHRYSGNSTVDTTRDIFNVDAVGVDITGENGLTVGTYQLAEFWVKYNNVRYHVTAGSDDNNFAQAWVDVESAVQTESEQ